MKKNLFWTILAGAALVSCVNDDVLEQHNQNRQELTFGNPVLNSQTKVTGEISGTTYPTDENFIVWGIVRRKEAVVCIWGTCKEVYGLILVRPVKFWGICLPVVVTGNDQICVWSIVIVFKSGNLEL